MNHYDVLEEFARPPPVLPARPLTAEEQALLERLARQIPRTIEAQRTDLD